MRLTVAQALVRFLSVQYSERDGAEQRLVAGCFGIFGHGNVAGVGQALLENAVYNKDGQLVTGSLMDYTMPRADDLPSFKVDTTPTPCPGNPLGIKGCGEAGAIAAPAAVINAITDAIGSEDLAMPATPQAVWAAIQKRNDGRKAA